MSDFNAQPEFFAPWHVNLGSGAISPRRLHLLQAIDSSGSVTQAAKLVGMTYKAAWDAVEIMNNLAGVPLVNRQHGGKGGGGATLTQTGLKIVTMHERLSAMQASWMASLEDVDADILPLMRRIKMQTSARNFLCGKISRITAGPVNVEVIIALNGGNTLASIITHSALDELKLTEGADVCALIKASHVLIGIDD